LKELNSKTRTDDGAIRKLGESTERLLGDYRMRRLYHFRFGKASISRPSIVAFSIYYSPHRSYYSSIFRWSSRRLTDTFREGTNHEFLNHVERN